MEKEVCSWIMEFVLRQPEIDDDTINTLLTVLPFPPHRYSLTKSLLLRRILSETSTAVSDTLLDLLEIIEELDRLASRPSPPSLPRAYRLVAVECSARAECPAEYEAVWRGRVGMMDAECGLLEEEVREGEAERAVREYVAEAWEELGPTLLEEVAGLVAAGNGVAREVMGVRKEGFGLVQDDGGLGHASRKDDTTREVLDVENNRVPQQQPIVNNVIDVSQNGMWMPSCTHVAKKRYKGSVSGTSRGSKITDTEQMESVDNEELSDTYGCLPSSAIDRAQEAPKNSSLELHAVVTDPLPEALKLAEKAISMKNKDSRVPEDLANEADPKRPSTSVENNVPKPNLMTRNTSACTYEWDDSIDDSTEGDTGSGSRIKLPSPKNRVVSPLPKPQMRNNTARRRHKKWSLLEEETLRTGVEKYGQGCWKAILNSYRDIFEDRTDSDLKDKWRNMTRSPRGY